MKEEEKNSKIKKLNNYRFFALIVDGVLCLGGALFLPILLSTINIICNLMFFTIINICIGDMIHNIIWSDVGEERTKP